MAEKSFQKFDSIFSRNPLKEWMTCGDNFAILTDCMQGMLDSPRACINTLQTKAPGSLVMKLFEAKGFCIKET